MRNQNETINYLTYEQAQEFVERIADRTKVFNHEMTENEKDAMAQLLSDIGVSTSDLIEVSYLADNYAVNAEIITPNDYDDYSHVNYKEDSLFQWEESDGIYYCLRW